MPCGSGFRLIEVTAFPGLTEKKAGDVLMSSHPQRLSQGLREGIAYLVSSGPTQCSLGAVISEGHLSPQGIVF